MQGEGDAMLRDSFVVLSQQSMPHRLCQDGVLMSVILPAIPLAL